MIGSSLNILVTGAFGYLGGRVSENLSLKGHQVTLGGSAPGNTPPHWAPNTQVVKIPWGNDSKLRSLCKEFDVVIHMAGMNSANCALNPLEAIKFNGLETARLVQASKLSGVSNFIFFSTVHVYNSPLQGIINENTCTNSIHPYATSNLIGENSVLYESDCNHEFYGSVLRLSNVVGSPTHKDANCWSLIVNDLCRQVVEKKSIIVKSNPLVQRDFIPISRVCSIIPFVLNKNKTVLTNIVSSHPLTLEDIVRIIVDSSQDVLGLKPKVVFLNKDKLEYRKFVISSNLNSLPVDSDTILLEIKSEIDQLLLNCKKWFGGQC
jgi:UDP-glucose 4-epimerase